MMSMSTTDSPRLSVLHPAWGGAVMSLSGAAFLSLRDPLLGTTADDVIGLVLLGVSTIAAIALSAASVLRLIHHRSAFAADLRNPGLGALVATWPASLLILALAILQAGTIGALPPGPAVALGMIVFVVGLAGTLFIGYAFFSRVIGLADVPPTAVTGAWFIPVVPLVLVPSVIVRAVDAGVPGSAKVWAFLALAAWGVGFMLFLLLAAIIGGRLLVASPPAAAQAATWWIWLAPLSAGGLGLLAAARVTDAAGLPTVDAGSAAFAAAVLWAVAVWWAFLAVRIIAKERRNLHPHVGWWGFGFPTVALAALTGELGSVFDLVGLTVTATILWAAVLILIGALVAMTVRDVRSGAAWVR
jgi:tellurite resistance protein TehA-like permease